LVNVYGTSSSEDKADNLVELVQVLSISSSPFMIGGVFNLVRQASERNKVKGYLNRIFYLIL
jgi:hypothetical protein